MGKGRLSITYIWEGSVEFYMHGGRKGGVEFYTLGEGRGKYARKGGGRCALFA